MPSALTELKRASLAEVTELMIQMEGQTKDYSVLLEGGAAEGDQVLSVFHGQTAFLKRNDGNLGIFSSQGFRGISRDGGRTFEYLPKFELPPVPRPTPRQRGGAMSYNSLAGLVKMKNGKLGLTWTQVYPIGGNQDIFKFYFRTSEDDGVTWSEDVLVNPGGDKGAPQFDTLRQLDSGRLIQPVRWLHWGGEHLRRCSVCSVNGEVIDFEGHGHHPELEIAYCYYSDDNGKTWSRSNGDIIGWFQDGWGNFLTVDEPALEQLPDGRLLMLSRTLIGRLLRCFSEDEGTTWSIPEPSPLASDGAPCAIRRIPQTGDILCLWNQISADEIRRGHRRCRLSAAITRDGMTWKHFRTFEWHPHVRERSEYIQPDEKIQLTRALEDIGELPQGHGSSSYPTAAVNGDEVINSYGHFRGRHPKKMVSMFKHRILPLSWFYEKS